MLGRILEYAILAMVLASSATLVHAAQWSPPGPIKMLIGFRAGGGVDTQARLIAEELEARKGWKVIPENVAGKGGANMARALKSEPADGLAIGMTVTEGISYSSMATRKAGYTPKDFTYLTTTCGTQTALFGKTSRGWKTLADVIAAAKAGEKITVGAMTPRLADATYLIGEANGIELTTVMVKGGKGGLNGVVADDLDLGWGAGPQNKGVAAGDLVNLVSAETEPLAISRHAATVRVRRSLRLRCEVHVRRSRGDARRRPYHLDRSDRRGRERPEHESASVHQEGLRRCADHQGR